MITQILSTILLVFNEIVPSNIDGTMSPATNFDSWVELYNPTDQTINLADMYLSNDASDLKRWQMPKDIGTIPANGFKVIWLGSNDLKDTQAPFKLNCDGGIICLSDASGNLVTSENYPETMSRTAWTRTTDGGEQWGWTATPTPGATNATASFANQRLSPPVVDTGSKLFSNTLNIHVDIPEGATLMYTTDGSLPTAPNRQTSGEPQPWTNLVRNGDCEGDDVTCLVGKDGNNSKLTTTIVDGAGYNHSRGIKVHAVANAADDWTSQFFVYTPDHIWNTGERYRFRMKVRAEKACHITVQSHKTPSNYIHWTMLDGGYNITTEWKEIVYEGTITSEQSGASSGGWWGGSTPATMQTIAFNLNEKKDADNNFYFDDISWETYTGEGGITVENSQESTDGNFSISQTTNYRFRLFRDGYLPSVPVTRSYIRTTQKYTVPIVAIVTDKRYLTDPMWGIDCDGSNGRTGNGQDSPRNYNMPWDRPMNLSYLTADGEMVFNQDVDVCVSGGWTRAISPRSLKLKSGKEFDGQNHLDYVFFPQKPFIRSKALLVRNGGNDVWEHHARFMDPALETIIQRSGIDLDVQSCVQVIEYVNGEYRGTLNLREPNNRRFVQANYGYDDEEIDMFENFVFNCGNDEALKRIFELGKHINDVGAYDELRQLLDVDEFTNYMAVELFLCNNDWPNNNVKAYRSQQDDRYRFISFDLDYSFKYDNPFTAFKGFSDMEFVTFFLNLLNHEVYRKKFVDTFCLVAGSVFEKDRALAIVNELQQQMTPMAQIDGHTPERAVNTIKTKLNNQLERMTTCLQQFKQMQLSGIQKQSVTLQADTEGAALFVNGLYVPYAYFKGHLFAPVTLEAKAPAGYQFAGWKKGSTIISLEPVMTLPSDNSLSLEATFKPLSDEERTTEGIAPVRINEVSAANNIYVNEYWKRNDWVELYNTTSQPIDVEGMYLSDNPDKPQKYQINKSGADGATTVIPAHGHLIIWCDKLTPQSQLHASFKLAAEGGDVLLTAADGSWCDRLTYPLHQGDQTVGRYPDGCSEVFLMNVPTIGRQNLTSSYVSAVEQPGISGISDLQIAGTGAARLHYTVGQLTLCNATDSPARFTVYDLSGQSVYQTETTVNAGHATVSLNHLPAGCYIARVTLDNTTAVTSKFINP